MPKKYIIHSLKTPSSLDSCVNSVNSFDRTKSFLSSFLKNSNKRHQHVHFYINHSKSTQFKFNPYVSGIEQSTTQLIRRFIQIHGLGDVVNGFCANAAFDLTINAFLKLLPFHSVGVVNLSKTSLGNFTISSEYLS